MRPGLWARVHRRLLPDDPSIGWVPYLWLSFLVLFVLPLLRPGYPAALRAVSLAALPLFVALYLRGFRERGARVMVLAGLIAALGIAFGPVNPGAGVFFVYAANFAGRAGPPRTGLVVLLVVVAAPFALAAATPVPPSVVWAGSGMGTLIGLVNIYYEELGRKERRLRLTAEEVGRQAAAAERERIARDLHDVLGRTLTVIAIKAELARRLVGRLDASLGGRPAVERELSDVEGIAREALTELRGAVSGYRSAGLAAELAGARQALAALGVELEVEADGPALSALPPPAADTFALVLREAVTNVVRHARARRCRVSLEAPPPLARLVVEDDGRGGPIREGTGVTGMRRRLAAAGGALQIGPRSGGSGTTLVAVIPAGPGGTP